MTKPPNIVEAKKRGLLTESGKGVHTFSNGTSWHIWADANCHECLFYDAETAGVACAFEAAAFLAMASPDLARLFGWTESEKYPGSFRAPQQCRFFRSKSDDDGNPREVPPDPDPRQLVLIADPTEDIGMPVRVPAPSYAMGL